MLMPRTQFIFFTDDHGKDATRAHALQSIFFMSDS
jgi:hypothetical protein